MAKYKFIYCEWADATADASWIKLDKLGVDTCAAAGFLVKETKESISIAATYSKEEVNAVITIPKAWIKKRRYIKL